jgi:N,N'-diacetylbacillosaminyl-diphospho-undecaprenol alpha-1,3-N-acetylgalactosaminyltransferase
MVSHDPSSNRTPATIALVCPDGYSVLLFCKGIIAALADTGWARILVLTDVGEHRGEIEALGTECIDIPVSRFIDPLGDLRYVYALTRSFRRERCDAVLNFSTKPNILGSIAARIAGCRIMVSHVVGLGSTFASGKSVKHVATRSLMRLLYRLACRVSTRVWFTNPADRAYFIRTGLVDLRKTILTRSYLDTVEYSASPGDSAAVATLRAELSLGPDKVVVLMVARLIWPKGVGEFAEAAKLLRDRRPECEFLLVAPPEPPSPQTIAEETVREFETDRNFQWLGFRRDMRFLYALCDIAVLPTYYKEGGYPRALLEPMSMGKPLVTTTSEDCRATVDEGRNGFLVPPRDGAALAAAIERLAASPELRWEFGRHSRTKAVSEFDERSILRGAMREAGLGRTE